MTVMPHDTHGGPWTRYIYTRERKGELSVPHHLSPAAMKYFAVASAFALSAATAVWAVPTLYLVGDSTMASHASVHRHSSHRSLLMFLSLAALPKAFRGMHAS